MSKEFLPGKTSITPIASAMARIRSYPRNMTACWSPFTLPECPKIAEFATRITRSASTWSCEMRWKRSWGEESSSRTTCQDFPEQGRDGPGPVDPLHVFPDLSAFRFAHGISDRGLPVKRGGPVIGSRQIRNQLAESLSWPAMRDRSATVTRIWSIDDSV